MTAFLWSLHRPDYLATCQEAVCTCTVPLQPHHHTPVPALVCFGPSPSLLHAGKLSRQVLQGPLTEDQIAHDPRLERVIGAILSGALKWSAADLYDAQAKLAQLTALARKELDKVRAACCGQRILWKVPVLRPASTCVRLGTWISQLHCAAVNHSSTV